MQRRSCCARNGNDIGNKVLLHGENGTGKTLAAAIITAQFCLENDWSMVQARWDEDLKHVLRFCELLGTPTALVIEDVEKLISNDPKKMDQLLEQFDGMRTKGREVLLLMTSNHVGELPKAMTRAGRINRMIKVSDLGQGRGGAADQRADPGRAARAELDYARPCTRPTRGSLRPGSCRPLKGVSKQSVIRTKELGQPLATADFVRCANALRPAWTLHTETEDVRKPPELETLLRRLVSDELNDHYVDISDAGDILVRRLASPPSSGSRMAVLLPGAPPHTESEHR